jgi:iron-sulfur cluster assembly accessory protein
VSIQLTKNAVKEINKMLVEQQLSDNTALRVRIVSGQCSGFAYKLELGEGIDNEVDIVKEISGITVVIDKKSLLYLDGIEIDFYSGLDKRGFVFNNPNSVKSCRCGKSFQA